MVPKSDFFTSPKLNPEWSFLGYTTSDKFSLSDRPGWLRLTPKSSSKSNTVIKNDGEHNYSLITRLDFNAKTAGDEAGLRIIRGDETQFVKLYSSNNADGIKVIGFSFGTTKYEADNSAGDTVWLKIIRVNHSVGGYFSSNGSTWKQVGKNVDISTIDSYSDFSSWIGTRQGLYVQGSPAWFDLYIYRDAFTPILAECPANQFGTTRSAPAQGISVLDNIHNTDRALYAGVEFGNAEYYETPDSVEFIASSATEGGSIEVWLDSIDTGIKIADCKIINTGSWYEFKRFTAPVSPVTGNHDVYLKFSGTGTSKICMLKWITFTHPERTVITSSQNYQNEKFTVYPNPAKTHLSIHSGFLFHTAEIFSINGYLLLADRKDESKTSSLDFNLENGLYLLKISGDKYAASSILMIHK